MSRLEIEQEIARCDREIEHIKALLRAGHEDVRGLALALVDWCTERRLLRAELRYSRND
jgi:hypothetical protein